jgi:hypothetical protein
VVVGDLIGSGASQEQAIVGETPNLAARLQGIAEPCDLLRQKNCKVTLLLRYKLQIGRLPRIMERQRVTMRLNKNAVRSGEYLVSPLVKTWRHQQIQNTQAMRLRDTKGQA